MSATLLSPGIYPGIPAAEYHALPYLGSSTLKKYRKNPATCQEEFSVDKRERFLIVGDASHALSLEGGDAFASRYAVAPDFPCPAGRNPKGWKNTNEYKDLVAQFEASILGKIRLTADEGAAVFALDAGLKSHPMASTFMEHGADELTVIWDEVLPDGRKVRCKARIDWFREGIPSDYKSTSRIDRLLWSMSELNYDVQAGHYSNGLIANKEQVKTFGFFFGETAEPYRIRTGYLSERSLDWGRNEAVRLIGLYLESLERDLWPNFSIPEHICSFDQLQPYDLLEEWTVPGRSQAC
jgi:hypothetical protein